MFSSHSIAMTWQHPLGNVRRAKTEDRERRHVAKYSAVNLSEFAVQRLSATSWNQPTSGFQRCVEFDCATVKHNIIQGRSSTQGHAIAPVPVVHIQLLKMFRILNAYHGTMNGVDISSALARQFYSHKSSGSQSG